MKDEHLLLLGEMNGKLDMLLARTTADEERVRAAQADALNAGWWGKTAIVLTIASLYPKARELIAPLLGL